MEPTAAPVRRDLAEVTAVRIVEQEEEAVGKYLEETVAIGKILPDGEAEVHFANMTVL
jgi:hypothetical protein